MEHQKIQDSRISANINGNDYVIPKNIPPGTLGFFVMNASSNISLASDQFSTQTTIDALFKPEEITEKTLISALIGENRSNQLYNCGIQSTSLPFKELYFKYAAKYAGKVAQLATAIAKIKNKEQKNHSRENKYRKRRTSNCRKYLETICPTINNIAE